MNLIRALGSIGGLTLASRVLGLVRDSLFFRFVGANFAFARDTRSRLVFRVAVAIQQRIDFSLRKNTVAHVFTAV